ncbi:lysophosphatidylcholine acyltransferase 1-like isoform X3 [Hemiscyllium ocellatum]|uniref:lysophosphatidylcholine acyltransferase 1-like isoform X3 n=1 Tax=Hemiscyllium ocellatum TaxID=170820 RepID=UPI002965E32C|nr:lysophosphatidylcholine acyltransferase 1-like isoform X3 [Hemiscyllium ocellatum]
MRLLRRGRCTAKVSGACGNEEEQQQRARLPPVRNPFVHDIRLSVLQKVQLAIMTVTLFPIRLLLAAFMMLLAWPFAFLAAWGRIEKEPERPMNMWRKTLDFLLKVIMRAMWFAGGFHWMTIKGRRALPKEAPIMTLAPHSSYFDAIPVTMTMASIVMKAESKDIPIWGSAFIPGVPVQPVVLRYPNKTDTITWTWQGPGALKILWLTLCQLHNNVEIEFLPIYTPSEEEKRNPILYANNVRKVMANALGVPVTDYTFEDCQLVMSDSQLKLPVDTCLLEFAKLARKLNLKPDKIEKELDELAESAKKMKGGLTTLDTFAHYLKLPICDAIRDMFLLFTENENGTIDIREYVIALSVVSRPSKTHETIKLAFRMYESIDQTITEDDLACILKTALGVNKLDVSKLFTVTDATQQRKISYMDFCKFSHANPDYAEEYLYPHQMMAVTDCMEKQLAATANGFCTDFSPDLHEEDKEDGTLDKKIN